MLLRFHGGDMNGECIDMPDESPMPQFVVGTAGGQPIAYVPAGRDDDGAAGYVFFRPCRPAKSTNERGDG